MNEEVSTRDTGQLFAQVRELLSAGTWEQLHRIVTRHPGLPSDATDTLIVDWLDERPDADDALVAALLRVRFVLARCRTVGTDAAFEDFIASTPQVDSSGEHPVSLSIGVILRCVGDAYDWKPEALEAFRDAVEPLLRDESAQSDADVRSSLWWCLGLCYHKLTSGERQQNLVVAVEYLTRFATTSAQGREPFPLQVLAQALADLALTVGPDLLLDDVVGWLATLEHAQAALTAAEPARCDIAMLEAVAHLLADEQPRFRAIQDAVALLEGLVRDNARLGRTAHLARAQNLLGEALRLQAFAGRETLERAVELFAVVEAAYEAGQPDDTTVEGFLFRVRARTNLALALAQRAPAGPPDDRGEAVQLLRTNLRALSANGIRRARPQVARQLADVFGWEDFRRSLAALRLTLRYLSPEDEPEARAEVHAQCGRLYASVPTGGNVECSIRHFERACATYTQREHGHRWAQVQVMLGATYANRSLGSREANLDEAVRCLRAALTVEDPARDHERNRARKLGDVLFIAKRWAEACDAYRRAIDAGLFVVARAQSRDAIHAELGLIGGLFGRAAYCLLRLGRFADAISEVEDGRTRMLALDQEPEGGLKGLSGEDQERLDAARIALAELAFERERIVVGAPWRRSEQSLATAYEAAAHTVAELVPRPPHPARFTDKDILALVPDGGALVVPLVTQGGSVAWIIPSGSDSIEERHVLQLSDATAHNLRLALVGAGEGYFGWLRAYFHRPRTIAAAGEPGVPRELWTDLLWHFSGQIWSALMGPIHERLRAISLPSGAVVTLVGTSELAMLPLAAARPGPDDARAFVDDYALVVAPSLLALRVAHENAARAAERGSSLLAVVDPRDNLRFATLEGSVLSHHGERFPLTIIPGKRATREAVLEALPNSSLVHFACHAGFNPNASLESRLDLAGDTQLMLRDLVAKRGLLRARLVVLSACETGITEVDRAPEESTGFALGFIDAGAAGVVSTLWQVNDLSTMLLMEHFYHLCLQCGTRIPVSLRQAQVWLRDVTAGELARHFADQEEAALQGRSHLPIDTLSRAFERFASKAPTDRPFAHPYFWAPFLYSGV